MPAMPHMMGLLSPRKLGVNGSDLRLRPALRNLLDMAAPPVDQPAKSYVEIDFRREADFLLRLLRRTDAVSHQRRLAARRVVDRLVGSGEVQELFGDLLQRRALAGSHIVEAVGRVGSHRA